MMIIVEAELFLGLTPHHVEYLVTILDYFGIKL